MPRDAHRRRSGSAVSRISAFCGQASGGRFDRFQRLEKNDRLANFVLRRRTLQRQFDAAPDPGGRLGSRVFHDAGRQGADFGPAARDCSLATTPAARPSKRRVPHNSPRSPARRKYRTAESENSVAPRCTAHAASVARDPRSCPSSPCRSFPRLPRGASPAALPIAGAACRPRRESNPIAIPPPTGADSCATGIDYRDRPARARA